VATVEALLELEPGDGTTVAVEVRAGGVARVGERGLLTLRGDLEVAGQEPLPPTTREQTMLLRVVSSWGCPPGTWPTSSTPATATRRATRLRPWPGPRRGLGGVCGRVRHGRTRVVEALNDLAAALAGDAEFADQVDALRALATAATATSSCGDLSGVEYDEALGDVSEVSTRSSLSWVSRLLWRR